MTPTERATRRLWPLDVLRGLAVLMVLGRHPPDYAWMQSHLWPAAWFRTGWAGVDLFFVLSGFLVGGLLLAEARDTGTVRPGRFLLRRGFKIYPAYWVFLLVTLPFVAPSASALAAQLLFIQNYHAPLPESWGHTWSLAVEEHFYLLLAIGATWVVRRRGASFAGLPWLVGAVLALCLAVRLLMAGAPYSAATHIMPTHLRLDALAVGVLLAYGWHLHPDALTHWRHRIAPTRGRLVLLTAACWLPALLVPVEAPLMHSVGLTFNLAGAAGLLLLALDARHRAPAGLERALAWLGTYSYSVYLWHYPMRFVAPWLLAPFGIAGASWSAYALYLVLPAFGILMARAVELPVLAVRDRLIPSRGAATPHPIPRLRGLAQPVHPGETT